MELLKGTSLRSIIAEQGPIHGTQAAARWSSRLGRGCLLYRLVLLELLVGKPQIIDEAESAK